MSYGSTDRLGRNQNQPPTKVATTATKLAVLPKPEMGCRKYPNTVRDCCPFSVPCVDSCDSSFLIAETALLRRRFQLRCWWLFTSNTVPQQYPLTSANYWGTVIGIGRTQMANVLSTEKQVAIIGGLAEGSSIRSIERITGVHRDTIMRLGVRVGKGCQSLLDHKMRDLSCQQLQLDEIWDSSARKSVTSGLTITRNSAMFGRSARLTPKRSWCRHSRSANAPQRRQMRLCQT